MALINDDITLLLSLNNRIDTKKHNEIDVMCGIMAIHYDADFSEEVDKKFIFHKALSLIRLRRELEYFNEINRDEFKRI